MLKTKIRDLVDLSNEIKVQYFKILLHMAEIDGELNLFELIKLYELMARIKVPQKERIYLLKGAANGSEDPVKICRTILGLLSGQERNILRFSLMKDLIIIMYADYHASPEERELFEELQVLLEINEDQLKIFLNEHGLEQVFFEEDYSKSVKTNRKCEILLITPAIGVGAMAMHMKDAKKRPLLSRRGKRQTEKNLFKATFLGLLSYGLLKWICKRKINNEEKFKAELYKYWLKNQERAKKYLNGDKQYLQKYLINSKVEDKEKVLIKNLCSLLDRGYEILQNTKPSIL